MSRFYAMLNIYMYMYIHDIENLLLNLAPAIDARISLYADK